MFGRHRPCSPICFQTDGNGIRRRRKGGTQGDGPTGVTSFLDASAPAESMSAFSTVRRAGRLTRAWPFRSLVKPKKKPEIFPARWRGLSPLPSSMTKARSAPARHHGQKCQALSRRSHFRSRADQHQSEPYATNAGTADKPRWVPGSSRGPAVYFQPAVLSDVYVQLGRAGIDPHMHADGDGAVRATLNGPAALRKSLPNVAIRPAIAHDEIVDPADFARYKPLGAIPVLSFQSQKSPPILSASSTTSVPPE